MIVWRREDKRISAHVLSLSFCLSFSLFSIFLPLSLSLSLSLSISLSIAILSLSIAIAKLASCHFRVYCNTGSPKKSVIQYYFVIRNVGNLRVKQLL